MVRQERKTPPARETSRTATGRGPREGSRVILARCNTYILQSCWLFMLEPWHDPGTALTHAPPPRSDRLVRGARRPGGLLLGRSSRDVPGARGPGAAHGPLAGG